ncbi:efflux RND transporter permease subunit [Arsenicibacter rosenii]|uniref:Multidrug transporter n=1 Tax=Arsenicibacter rosenii TaxID=1750698 RepID=A0A1S2VM84_9BACT|nr:efflux RND transporter permease subunit [Arsenicibacter rosenii]OIN59490.1 multidrug transporter [Arsenicibacter rosenii]
MRYQLIILFSVLSLIGLALLPKLPVQLAPSDRGQGLTVSYYWSGASPLTLERQVTARLEGVLSTLSGVEKIASVSGYKSGYITLTFDKQTNPDDARLEVAALLRQVYRQLPPDCSYPEISVNAPDDEAGSQKPLFVLQLSGPVAPAALQRFADEQLKPRLATTTGVATIRAFGGAQEEWLLTYDANQLNSLHLTEADLRQALQQHFRRESLGVWQNGNGQHIRVALNPVSANPFHIPVANRNGRLIYLTDLVAVSKQEPQATQFYRINGQDAINVVVTAAKGANQLQVAARLRQQINAFRLPAGYRLSVEYDATEFIRENLQKTGIQSAVAVLILLLFVGLSTLSWRYVGIIVISSVVTLLLSVIVFALLGTEIHLYSLAALTTSLGILMDNVIVMIDHYRKHGDRQVFTALLGATLTTCAGLIVVWFLPEENRQALSDFAVVMAVTLFVSLLVAVGFVPALIRHVPQPQPVTPDLSVPVAHTVSRFGSWYARFLTVLLRYRKTAALPAVLLFGLPFFWLPNRLETDHPMAPYYNATLGSDWYLDTVQPILNKWLGGTLRLFVNYVYEGSYYSTPERTTLYVIAELPNQSTSEQMDAVFRRLEQEMGRYGEIDKYITQVSSGQEGYMVVYFKRPFEDGLFPYQLKNRAIMLSTDMSGIDWNIYGVGQGFSQQLNEEEVPSFNVELFGYNYQQLDEQANRLKGMLEKHPRIQEVNTNRSPSLYQRKRLYEFVLQTAPQQLALRDLPANQLYTRLADLNARPQPDDYQFIGDTYTPVTIAPAQYRTTDIWQLTHQPLNAGNRPFLLSDAGTLDRQKVVPDIQKEAQQYKRLISFEYFGSYHFGEKYLNETLTAFRQQLPMGYSVKPIDRFWFGTDSRRPYELIGLVVVLIYLVCVVIFESLWQPLALIGLIPLSYTGVFLAFYWTDSNFDQGGYAAFVLLAGNVVCAGIFIIAEMNRLRRTAPQASGLSLYINAFHHKIRPILLTVLSTVVGMIPFLLYEKEPFWYALGIGTIGGLLMSLPTIVIYLPLMIYELRGTNYD